MGSGIIGLSLDVCISGRNYNYPEQKKAANSKSPSALIPIPDGNIHWLSRRVGIYIYIYISVLRGLQLPCHVCMCCTASATLRQIIQLAACQSPHGIDLDSYRQDIPIPIPQGVDVGGFNSVC